MGFFSGRVTCARFRVNGHPPGMFGPEHLDRLQARAVGKQRSADGDGVEVGWIAGDHILDTSFDLAKNVVNESLSFALRVDQTRIPGDLMRAYTAVELTALTANNPSGRPSARQKREARTNAKDKLEDEARDGRFLKRKATPVLWDAPSNELLVGTTSVTVIDRLHTLFEQTFGQAFEPLTSGKQAYNLAQAHQLTRGIDDAEPSAFVPGMSADAVSWVPDENSRDYLGNEYLLWLWFMLDSDTDTIKLPDGSEVALMLTRTMALECPRGQSGKETFSFEAPTRLPEARRAIQSGKLPRKIGMILSRHDQQYDLTMQGDSMVISGARLPAPEAENERGRLEERVTQLRHLLETLDLLYDTFTRGRSSEEWTKELGRMQKWLQREERPRLSAIG